MSSLWTPYGEEPVPPAGAGSPPSGGGAGGPGGPGGPGGGPADDPGRAEEASTRSRSARCSPGSPRRPSRRSSTQSRRRALGDSRCCTSGSPAERPESLAQAALAVDAMAGLVDALGDRLGPHAEPLRQASPQLRLGFVRSSRCGTTPPRRERADAGVCASRTTRSSATPRPRRWSARTGRSTGSASRASTRARASRRCSATDEQRPLADRAGRRRSRRAPPLPRATRWSSRPTFDTDDGVGRGSIDFMPIRDERADVVRIVEGVAGRVAMRHGAASSGSTTARSCPWVRAASDGVCRAVAGPDAICACARRCDTRGRGPAPRSPTSRSRPATGCRSSSTWHPSHRAGADRRSTPSGAARRPSAWWRTGRRSCTYDGEWRDAVDPLADHAQGADLRARPAASWPPPRRRCPRRSAACATGTTASAGCATRRSRCTR